MAMDNAIRNVGEYYAAHYLAEQFGKDIAEQIKAWKAQGSQSVPRRLQALSDPYFRAKTRALDDPEPQARGRDPEVAAWHGRLLHALGCLPEPLDLELHVYGGVMMRRLPSERIALGCGEERTASDDRQFLLWCCSEAHRTLGSSRGSSRAGRGRASGPEPASGPMEQGA